MRRQILSSVGLVLLTLAQGPPQAAAGTISYLLRTSTASQAQAVCQRYGLQLVANLGKPDSFLVQGSDALPPDVLKQWTKDDPDVQNLEVDNHPNLPEKLPPVSGPYIPSLPATDYVTDGKLIKLYGTRAWAGYVQQPAMFSTNAVTTTQQNFIGTGVTVAVIDTGVDPANPILAPVLVPGYDFTRNVAGYASDLTDIDGLTAEALEQRSLPVLDRNSVVQLNPFAAAFLEQRTVAVLDPHNLPALLGHGTMVAGLIHLVAPGAQIMPLKAFNADGSSSLSNIVRAIYYATDNGAKVINMSFEISQISDELVRALSYASRNGVICVASAGNDGQRTLVYPAGLGTVIGVASVSQENQASSFTNSGPNLVTVAAPGEGLVTTYLGSHYAAVWGTSFSTGLVSGAAAALVNATDDNTRHQIMFNDVQRALSNTNAACSANGDLGAGCLDLIQATHYIHDTRVPTRHHY
jgi:subtilisin family serine protease